MQLNEFFDYKNRLMMDLLTNDTVVSLIKTDSFNGDVKDLAYDQVFPYEHIPETAELAKTYICFDVDITASINEMLYAPVIHIWVFTHISEMRLPEGGVRVDKLASEICDMLNGSRYYGLGKLDLYSVKRFAPCTDYLGKVLTFHAVDVSKFNKPGRKGIPANRKEY